MSQAVADGPTIFTPRAATRFEPWAARFRFDLGDGVFVGENLPYGAGLAVYLPPEEESEEAGASESAAGAARMLTTRGRAVRRPTTTAQPATLCA